MPAPELSRRRLGGLLAAALAWPAAARAQTITTEHSGLLLPTPGGVYVPPTDMKTISDIFKRMTAPVTINGAGPFDFVVDTGANQSVIATDLADQLGLVRGEDQALNGVAGVQATASVTARLKMGDRPETEGVLSVLPREAIGGPGMLGLDRLDGGRLTLDFRRQRLSIDNGRGRGGPDEITLGARRRAGQLTLVDADVAGIRLTAFLDSGAQDTIGNEALRALAITRYPKTPWSAVPILSVTGQTINAEFADLPGLRLGGLHIPSWPVAFADLHTFRMWDLIRQPAILIGVDVLSRFETVCLDFVRDEVRFRLPQRA